MVILSKHHSPDISPSLWIMPATNSRIMVGVQASLCQGDLANPLDLIGKAIERACVE